MNDSERQRMIDKIRKVVALSTSPNEAEAAAAAEKAQAMLAEYNLSMSDLNTDQKDEDLVIIEDDDAKTESVPWRRRIASGVAKLYFCTYFYTFVKEVAPTRGCGYIRSDKHTFIGEQHNVAVAKMMFKYLGDAVERLSGEAALAYPTRERSSYRTSFKLACATRLYWRMHERIEASKRGEVKSEGGKNLPALLDLYTKTGQQLQTYMQQKHKKLGKSRSTSNITRHAAGWNDGEAAAEKIGLDPQVSGKAAAHLLK